MRAFMAAFLEYLISFMIKVIAIPGARQILSPVFCHLVAFEDLYFYQFHDRTYGETMASFFQNINAVQESKWGIVNYERILGSVGADKESFTSAT